MHSTSGVRAIARNLSRPSRCPALRTFRAASLRSGLARAWSSRSTDHARVAGVDVRRRRTPGRWSPGRRARPGRHPGSAVERSAMFYSEYKILTLLKNTDASAVAATAIGGACRIAGLALRATLWLAGSSAGLVAGDRFRPKPPAGKVPLLLWDPRPDPDVLARFSAARLRPTRSCRPARGSVVSKAKICQLRRCSCRAAGPPSPACLRFPSRHNIARLDHFESGEYQAERRRCGWTKAVDCEAGSTSAFLPHSRLQARIVGTSPLGSSSTRPPSSPNATPGWPTAPSPTEPARGPGG